MPHRKLSGITQELNLIWLMSVKEAVALDRDAAMLAFGLSQAHAAMLENATAATLRCISRCGTALFRPEFSAETITAYQMLGEDSEELARAFLESHLFDDKTGGS